MVFHEKDEKDVDKSTPEKAVYTGRISVDTFLKTILSVFNEVWRMKFENGKYSIICKPNAEFTGATTFTNISDTEMPNISEILKKNGYVNG